MESHGPGKQPEDPFFSLSPISPWSLLEHGLHDGACNLPRKSFPIPGQQLLLGSLPVSIKDICNEEKNMKPLLQGMQGCQLLF